MRGNINHSIGKENEEILTDIFNKNRKLFQLIAKNFGNNENVISYTAERIGHLGKKSDFTINTSNGDNYSVTVKSFKGNGFNQVSRVGISRFISNFNLSVQIKKVLERATIRYATKTTQKWITDEIKDTVVNSFKSVAFDIIQDSLSGEDNPMLLVLMQSDVDRIYFFKMDDFLKQMKEELKTEITPRGVISLHPCFTIQRKGGNGRKDDALFGKESLKHGGNDLQIKMKSLAIIKSFSSIVICNYAGEIVNEQYLKR